MAPLENGSGMARYASKILKSLTRAGRTSDESIASAVEAKGYLGARRSGRIVRELSRLFVAIGDQFYGGTEMERAKKLTLLGIPTKGFSKYLSDAVARYRRERAVISFTRTRRYIIRCGPSNLNPGIWRCHHSDASRKSDHWR